MKLSLGLTGNGGLQGRVSLPRCEHKGCFHRTTIACQATATTSSSSNSSKVNREEEDLSYDQPPQSPPRPRRDSYDRGRRGLSSNARKQQYDLGGAAARVDTSQWRNAGPPPPTKDSTASSPAAPRTQPQPVDQSSPAASSSRAGRSLFNAAPSADDQDAPFPSTASSQSATSLRGNLRGSGMNREDGSGSEGPKAPPRLPVVHHRLDLPIVRESESDKGTFFSEGRGWRELGLGPDIVAALKDLGLRKPSHVQAATLHAWRSSDTQHLAVADQAGSGKTLAYLLPLFQALRAEDAAAGSPATQSGHPRAVVIAPTAELVQQVYRVAKALSKAGARLKVSAMTGGQEDERARSNGWKTQLDLLSRGVDLVITTPGRVKEHIRKGSLKLDSCKAVVLDEVDILLGENTAFADQVAPLKTAAPPSLRFVLVTATLPQHTATALKAEFPDMGLAVGPGLHKTASGLTEELIDCSGGTETTLESGTLRKLEALNKVLKQHRQARTLIFCNKIESCRAVENALRRNYSQEDLQVLVFHEAIREDVRQAAMNAFLSPINQEASSLAALSRSTSTAPRPRGSGKGTEGGSQEQGEVSSDLTGSRGGREVEGRHGRGNLGGSGREGERERQREREWEEKEEREEEKERRGRAGRGVEAGSAAPRLVMIATDRMSRGIDSMYCNHVVLFDFPRDPSEYVRRVGRTARGAGGKGVVSALVLGRQVALAQQIIGRNQKGQPVHRLPQL